MRWFCGLALAAVAAVSAAADGASSRGTLQAGDLVFRRGTESVSALVLAVDRGRFSHVGMVVGRPGDWKVLHATPSEVPGQPDGVTLDSMAFFLDATRSTDHAFYAVHATPRQRDAAVRHALDVRGMPFRVGDASGTYCTLLVWDAWRRGGVDLDVRFSRVALPLMQGDYLLPSQLRLSSRLRPLARHAADAADAPVAATAVQGARRLERR